jgi:hypothetical protein
MSTTVDGPLFAPEVTRLILARSLLSLAMARLECVLWITPSKKWEEMRQKKHYYLIWYIASFSATLDSALVNVHAHNTNLLRAIFQVCKQLRLLPGIYASPMEKQTH